MRRFVIPSSLLVVSGAIALAALASCLVVVFFGVPPAWGTSGRRSRDAASLHTNKLHEKLAQHVNLERGIEPNTPLKDALEFLSQRHDLTILVDTKAFDSIGVQKAEEQPVQLPKMSGVSLGTVLRLLASQLKGDVHGGTFLVRDDWIEFTTTHRTGAALWTTAGRQFVPVVDADIDGQPLDDALRDLSSKTGINIVLDNRVERQGRTEVTASLHGVALDTAVRLLADMAGLRMAILDNVLYVTSKDNAREIDAEAERLAKKTQEGTDASNPLLAK